MAATSFLSEKPNLRQLTTSLRNLRQTWPQEWPGLPLVYESAWCQLAPGLPRKAIPADPLVVFGRMVVDLVERDGAARQSQGLEPSYHNRLHIADTLVCMTYLLKAARFLAVPGADNPAVAAMALSIMAGHDFLHPGGANTLPSEFEARAVHDLKPLMRAAGLPKVDRQNLAHCIMATDPARVREFHLQVRSRHFDLMQPNCLAVLVQEADILASVLPQTAKSLTLCLSHEWAPLHPVAAAQLLQPKNRLLFLEHAAWFSSPAARLLGLDAVKRRQIVQIRSQLESQS